MVQNGREKMGEKFQVIPGDVAARLHQEQRLFCGSYSRHGKEEGLSVDEAGFEAAQAAHAEASRVLSQSHSAMETKDILSQVALSTTLGEPTDDTLKYAPPDEPTRAALRGAFQSGKTVGIVLDKTPFYAEAGGQCGDSGRIVGNGWELVVKDTQLAGAYVVHLCKAAEIMDIDIGGTVEVQVDMDDRRLIAANHSATHLLNHALRTTLGSDCDQRGSLCDARRVALRLCVLSVG